MPSAYLNARLRSFGHAMRGLKQMFDTQHNARIHALATVLVLVGGAFAGLSGQEWALIVFAIAGVWAAEAFNTSIEFLVDLVSPETHSLAGKAKDVAAGAVLVTAIAAAIIGAIVFGPHVLALLGR